MKKNLELSKNLKLTHIDENNWKDGRLIAVELYFNFFGEDGIAYVAIDKLDVEYPNYAMTEISSELSDSFNDQIEKQDNWIKIVSVVNEYVKMWYIENDEDN